MRILFILLELAIFAGLISFAVSLVLKITRAGKKEAQWKKWKETTVKEHSTNIKEIKTDLEQLMFAMQGQIPTASFQSLSNIAQTVHILSEQEQSFNQWKNTYTEESSALMDILYKHIPESLNRYFSVPSSYAGKQKHRNGKSANELLDDTFAVFEQKFLHIAKEMVSENINKLKTYQTFVQDKYHEKEIEY